jgi:hypothetical protein
VLSRRYQQVDSASGRTTVKPAKVSDEKRFPGVLNDANNAQAL